MIERTVLRCRFDDDRRATWLVAPSADWSPRSVEDVVADIHAGRCRYVIPWASGPATVVVVGDGDTSQLEAAGPDGHAGGLSLLPAG